MKFFLIGLVIGLIFLAKRDSPCDRDCLGCKHFENDCEGDDFTQWLLYEADDDEY